jgi:hypothetical protein
MSLVVDIEECLRRCKTKAHQTTPIPLPIVEGLVARYGPLPPSIAGVCERIGKVEMFWGKGEFSQYNLAVCYKLQMSRVGENEFYLNVGAWIYDGAVYYRWCSRNQEYLPGICGARGSGIAKNFDSIEHWFAACVKKARKQYDKTEWEDQLGMKGFKPSGAP